MTSSSRHSNPNSTRPRRLSLASKLWRYDLSRERSYATDTNSDFRSKRNFIDSTVSTAYPPLNAPPYPPQRIVPLHRLSPPMPKALRAPLFLAQATAPSTNLYTLHFLHLLQIRFSLLPLALSALKPPRRYYEKKRKNETASIAALCRHLFLFGNKACMNTSGRRCWYLLSSISFPNSWAGACYISSYLFCFCLCLNFYFSFLVRRIAIFHPLYSSTVYAGNGLLLLGTLSILLSLFRNITARKKSDRGAGRSDG